MSDVLTETRGPALWIRINREERRNALTPGVLDDIHAAIRAAEKNADLRAIVLTGAGDKAFCAGADLTAGAAAFTAGADEPTTDFGRLARTARGVGLPIIGRINGACVAGGMGLMALCDMTVVAEHAKFGLPEGKVGVFAYQVLVYLRHMLHPRHVNELCLTGDLIDAARAKEIGIANYVVPGAELDAKVEWLIQRVSALSPAALKRGKYAIAAMESMDFGAALAFAESQIAIAANSEDAREGRAAFNERRSPRWATPGSTP
jgi:enoyl-CoA hydratase/carnithine racemase